MKLEQITSRDNRRLVEARKVRDGKVPGKMFAEGTRLVREALRSDISIEECFFSDDFDDDELRNAFHGPVFELSAKLFSSIAATDNSQGVIVVAKCPDTSSLRTSIAPVLPVVIYLHEINNPANLGAVIRTAEAAGAGGVIISNNSADVFSTKALRAAMGSSFRMSIWENAGFDDVLRWAKEYDYIPTAADVSAATSYTNVNWKKPRLLICGSEAHGLTDAQLDRVDEKVCIPMQHGVESLNLAVSAGVILFEAKRQNDN